jgi:hypothetical protein
MELRTLEGAFQQNSIRDATSASTKKKQRNTTMNKSLSKTFGGVGYGAVAALLMFGTTAGACSLPGGMGLRPVNFADLSVKLGLPQPEAEARPADLGNSPASVVGLWQVTYSSGGAVVDMAFEVFHSDGTEMLNDITPPAEGNVCLGVWVQVEARNYRLNHPSWVFDANGNLTGTAVFDVHITMGEANTLSGTYSLTYYDTHGAKGTVYTGTLAATRVLPNY